MIRNLCWLVLVGLLGLLGCRRDSQRYDVWGKVTFRGVPVPRGQIIFSPDASKGNDGLQGYAEIEGGFFDTRKGRPAGHVVVRIEGFDGQVSDDQPFGKALFVGYQVNVEMPPEAGPRDFEVPAAAADSVKKLSGMPP